MSLDPQRIADLALRLTFENQPARNEEYTGAEHEIAARCGRYLVKIRRRGYAKEQCRLAFWNKIYDEIRRAG